MSSTVKVDNLQTRSGAGSIQMPSGVGLQLDGATKNFTLKNVSDSIGLYNHSGTKIQETNDSGVMSIHNGNITFKGPNHDFIIKAVNQPITGATNSTNDDANSDQLAIYNGSTKLWGISEAGYVVNPTLPCFVAHVTGGAYTSTSGVFPANATNHNQGNHYSTSTYAFTAPIDGVYLFTFSALSNNTGSTSRPMFYVNGSSAYNGIQHGIGNVDGNGSNSNSTSCLIKLTAGDYVQVKSQNGSLYYYAGAHSSFSGCLIG